MSPRGGRTSARPLASRRRGPARPCAGPSAASQGGPSSAREVGGNAAGGSGPVQPAEVAGAVGAGRSARGSSRQRNPRATIAQRGPIDFYSRPICKGVTMSTIHMAIDNIVRTARRVASFEADAKPPDAPTKKCHRKR